MSKTVKITKEDRRKIVQEFIDRRGHFDATMFLEEVENTGKDHPAYHWFEWDVYSAAYKYNVERAREFVRNINITYETKTIKRGVSGVVVRKVPAFISPVDDRTNGGGYMRFDPTDPESIRVFSIEANKALHQYIDRYQAVLEIAGVSVDAMKEIANRLIMASGDASDASEEDAKPVSQVVVVPPADHPHFTSPVS